VFCVMGEMKLSSISWYKDEAKECDLAKEVEFFTLQYFRDGTVYITYSAVFER
jgi:hypothetical protein